jgi:hypothetical protein
MKRALPSFAALVFIPFVFILFFKAATAGLHAQSSTSSIAGTWQIQEPQRLSRVHGK